MKKKKPKGPPRGPKKGQGGRPKIIQVLRHDERLGERLLNGTLGLLDSICDTTGLKRPEVILAALRRFKASKPEKD